LYQRARSKMAWLCGLKGGGGQGRVLRQGNEMLLHIGRYDKPCTSKWSTTRCRRQARWA
jgi:hypothetical protein